MPRRIDLGRAVLLLGAVLLFISLFLRWYDTGPTGWQVFETLDLVLAALAVGAAVLAVRPDLAPPWGPWAAPVAALVIVGVQLVNTPPGAGGGDPSTGAWLALAGGAVMLLGAATSVASISVTVQVRERELRRREAAVDRRRDRLGPREAPASTSTGPVAAPPPAADGDLDRTQPLAPLPDSEREDRETP